MLPWSRAPCAPVPSSRPGCPTSSTAAPTPRLAPATRFTRSPPTRASTTGPPSSAASSPTAAPRYWASSSPPSAASARSDRRLTVGNLTIMRYHRHLLAFAVLTLSPVAAGAVRAADAKPVRVGVLGLDNYQAVAYTELFNDPKASGDLAGVRVVAAFPGTASEDLPES